MLTFYPEFEADCIVDNEIILCLDCSNSMKVNVYPPTHHYQTQPLSLYSPVITWSSVVNYVCTYWPNCYSNAMIPAERYHH